MKLALISALFVISAFAQTETKFINASAPVMISTGGEIGLSKTPVQGAPYSATTVNESVQMLADGNRIVQTMSGATARDSQGRTRQDMPLPPIGNLAPANAPHMVMIQDPVAQTMYSLNLTDKTAHKVSLPPGPPVPVGGATAGMRVAVAGVISASPLSLPTTIATTGPLPAPGIQKTMIFKSEPAEAKTENLGTQTMEGVQAQGTRTTRTIPAGEIGNDKPIDIVTEVWTSPELKTVVYSKRSDPRVGEQIFRLTNISRAEPDASLFTVPADFKIVDGSQPGQDVIFYRSVQ